MSKSMSNKSRSEKGIGSATVSELNLIRYLSRKPSEKIIPDKIRVIHHFTVPIPQGRDAWLDYLCWLVKTKRIFTFLPDREIKKTLAASRRVIAKEFSRHQGLVIDHRLPLCFYWSIGQVCEWLDSVNLGQFKETFQNNFITGRRLIKVDASALNQMGLRYFDDIKNITAKIRELLKIHPSNMMRAIVRKVPWNLFLTRKQFSGNKYDLMTFRKFCMINGFPFDAVVKHNPCALIACSTQILIQESLDEMLEEMSETGSEHSIIAAPSVEFHARHIIVRNRVLDQIIEILIDCALARPIDRKYGDKTARLIKQLLEAGFVDLGIGEDEIEARIEFGRLLAEEMVLEAKRTHRVLNDIKEFKQFMQEMSVSKGELEEVRNICSDFFDAAALVAGLAAVAERDIEDILREDPIVLNFVEGILHEAEEKIEEQVPLAEYIVTEILDEAKLKILASEFPALPEESVREARNLALSIVETMVEQSILSSEGLYFPFNPFEVSFGSMGQDNNKSKVEVNKSNSFVRNDSEKEVYKSETEMLWDETQRSRIEQKLGERSKTNMPNTQSAKSILKSGKVDDQLEVHYFHLENGYSKYKMQNKPNLEHLGGGENGGIKKGKDPTPLLINEVDNLRPRAIMKSITSTGKDKNYCKREFLATASDSTLCDRSNIRNQRIQNVLSRCQSMVAMPCQQRKTQNKTVGEKRSRSLKKKEKKKNESKIKLLSESLTEELGKTINETVADGPNLESTSFVENLANLVSQQEITNEEYAQIVRLAASQVAQDVMQKAFSLLLIHVKSENDSQKLLEVLNKMKYKKGQGDMPKNQHPSTNYPH